MYWLAIAALYATCFGFMDINDNLLTQLNESQIDWIDALFTEIAREGVDMRLSRWSPGYLLSLGVPNDKVRRVMGAAASSSSSSSHEEMRPLVGGNHR
jgi:hypothetical protein